MLGRRSLGLNLLPSNDDLDRLERKRCQSFGSTAMAIQKMGRHMKDLSLPGKLEFQMGQLAEAQQKNESGRFLSQPEQAKFIMSFMHGGSEKVEKPREIASQPEEVKAILTMRNGKLLDTGVHGDKKVANSGRMERQIKQSKLIEEKVSLEEEYIEEVVKPYVPPNIPVYATFPKELIGKRRKYEPNE
ncbi:hypothetical protein LIER_23541 [Lithospermum erythrorhizon]|uniref:Uncharacterized protein n=1 Tax=Lithospermum erythrorhizon TaxID=34254 RepID=A0AAV3R089_LITER